MQMWSSKPRKFVRLNYHIWKIENWKYRISAIVYNDLIFALKFLYHFNIAKYSKRRNCFRYRLLLELFKSQKTTDANDKNVKHLTHFLQILWHAKKAYFHKVHLHYWYSNIFGNETNNAIAFNYILDFWDICFARYSHRSARFAAPCTDSGRVIFFLSTNALSKKKYLIGPI